MDRMQMAEIIAEILAVDTEEGNFENVLVSDDNVKFDYFGEQFVMKIDKIV